MNKLPKFFIGVASKDHVSIGLEQGFGQFCHGKSIARMSRGDIVVYYSPKLTINGSTACQQFTAIGKISDDAPYQVNMEHVAEGFRPFRRNIDYYRHAKPALIRPLIPSLDCIKNKKHWGMCFRSGLLEIDRGSFDLIATQMLGHIPL